MNATVFTKDSPHSPTLTDPPPCWTIHSPPLHRHTMDHQPPLRRSDASPRFPRSQGHRPWQRPQTMGKPGARGDHRCDQCGFHRGKKLENVGSPSSPFQNGWKIGWLSDAVSDFDVFFCLFLMLNHWHDGRFVLLNVRPLSLSIRSQGHQHHHWPGLQLTMITINTHHCCLSSSHHQEPSSS